MIDKSVFKYENGYVKIPQSPGLGIEINEDHVRKSAETDVDWHNPIWRHKDGSIAEW